MNGAIREMGFAFGVALLGTIMNRTYRDASAAHDGIKQLRENPQAGPLQPVLDLIGSGINYAGQRDPGPEALLRPCRQISRR